MNSGFVSPRGGEALNSEGSVSTPRTGVCPSKPAPEDDLKFEFHMIYKVRKTKT